MIYSKFPALVTLFCMAALTGWSNNGGYSIEVVTNGFEQSEIYLAFYLGNNQYVQDTARGEDGTYTFEGEEKLEPGVYLVVFPPDNQYFQLFVTADDQTMAVQVDTQSLQLPVSVEGSEDNELFFEYANYISAQRRKADSVRSLVDSASTEERRSSLQKHLSAIDSAVKARQEEILSVHGSTLTAMMIRSTLEPRFPEFGGTDEEIQEKKYWYFKKHYFDNLDLSDPRIVRTPFLYSKIEYYLDKLTFQVPDSLNAAVDHILGQFDEGSEGFKVYLVSFLNKYARSKIVGMDAVYVHLVEKYYEQGKAPWTEEEQLKKIVDNAAKLKPILIGKVAPDLALQDRTNAAISLHDVDADYTVLFFWDPECGHCKKSIPALKDFYREFSSKDVEIMAVCTKIGEGVKDCWDAIDEREMGAWINTADPYLRSRYKQIYDIRSTPQIYILDSDKTILMKKISVEQLPDVMDKLMGNTPVE